MRRSFARYDPRLVPVARRLRQDATLPERLVWSRLRRRALGVRFLRQRPVGPYVVGFLAPEARLVVEVDGWSHRDTGEEDATRQAFLERTGFVVLRAENADVLRDLGAVVDQVRAAVESRLPP